MVEHGYCLANSVNYCYDQFVLLSILLNFSWNSSFYSVNFKLWCSRHVVLLRYCGQLHVMFSALTTHRRASGDWYILITCCMCVDSDRLLLWCPGFNLALHCADRGVRRGLSQLCSTDRSFADCCRVLTESTCLLTESSARASRVTRVCGARGQKQ